MKTAVVICPGRGTYNATELGYLARHFPDADLMARFDSLRAAAGQDSLSDLDAADRFSLSRHGRGDNASALIFAASYGDFLTLSSDEVEVVAVTGNSMGWYTALTCGGALAAEDGFTLCNTMGTLMQEALIGGQVIYPWMSEDWAPDLAKKATLLALVEEINTRPRHELSLSIDLGGMLVLAGNETGLIAFEQAVPKVQGRFPMRLGQHAAFHSPLQAPVAQRGRERIAADMFGQPQIPLIDGRGAIWWPGACDPQAMWDYTLNTQVVQTYDFTRAVAVAAREFAPDLFIVAGPGTTLGGALAQSLILADWQGLSDKPGFKTRQADTPLLISMGMQDQRGLV